MLFDRLKASRTVARRLSNVNWFGGFGPARRLPLSLTAFVHRSGFQDCAFAKRPSTTGSYQKYQVGLDVSRTHPVIDRSDRGSTHLSSIHRPAIFTIRSRKSYLTEHSLGGLFRSRSQWFPLAAFCQPLPAREGKPTREPLRNYPAHPSVPTRLLERPVGPQLRAKLSQAIHPILAFPSTTSQPVGEDSSDSSDSSTPDNPHLRPSFRSFFSPTCPYDTSRHLLILGSFIETFSTFATFTTFATFLYPFLSPFLPPLT